MQKDLTKGDLSRNLLTLALPIMASNLVQTLYNLTDAFWLGKLGEGAREAVAAVGISFPLIFFLQSFGFGFVVSGNTLVAQYKGANKPEKIHRVTGQYFLILICFSFFFLLVSLLLLESILKLLQTPEEIFINTHQYLSIIIPAQVFMFIVISIQSFFQGVGDTITPMRIQIISVGANLLIDPLFIFGFSFIEGMGVIGAAWATLIARVIAAILAFRALFTVHKELIPEVKDLIPDKEILNRILKISIPASFGQSMTSFGFIILQGFVNSYGTVIISTHTLNNRIQSLFMMPAMGISNALSAIVGQNLGAGEIRRAQKSAKVAMKLVLSIMGVGGIIVFFFGSPIISIFINDSSVISLGGEVMKLTCFTSFIFGAIFVYIGVFNGSGYTRATMTINIARLWLFRIPLVFLLSGMILNYGIVSYKPVINILRLVADPLKERPYFALWYSMLISNFLSVIWASLIYKKGQWKNSSIT